MKSILKKVKTGLRDSKDNVMPKEEVPEDLDLDFYKSYYEDLSRLSNDALIHHWLQHGKQEGRFGSLERVLFQEGIDESEFDQSLIDEEFYLDLYPDLFQNGVKSAFQAAVHYFSTGVKENRIPSLKAWLKSKELHEPSFDYEFIYSVINANHYESLQAVLDIISAEKILPIQLDSSVETTANTYLQLALSYLMSGSPDKAKSLLKVSISFYKTAEAFERIGNLYFDQNDLDAAVVCYEQALTLDPQNYWSLRNAVKVLVEKQQFDRALNLLQVGFLSQKSRTELVDFADEVCKSYYESISVIASVDCDLNDREALLDKYIQYSEKVYSTYQAICNSDSLPELKAINLERILIVGDYHVAQCERYRITQKIEQLELQGRTVTAIDWLDLNQKWNELSNHDVVIFYRVPALPSVLKAMAQVNAAGKLSIYEIDDLLFDPEYPPALETYGGYVALHVYHELMKGMGLFNAAARYCRIGLASTVPLAVALEELVIEKQCLVHRNGLDTLNEFKTIDRSGKQTVDIFYGSGTQAHNSDFIEQVMPALERVLRENEQVRLIIAGYLNLPNSFVAKFKSQIKQIPPVKNVKNYWSLLEQADINIAVLHEDKITNAKSELKWFEAACFAIPSVLSSTENYRDVIYHNEDALLVEDSDEWFQALTDLVKNQEKRQALGLAAQERVKQEYSLQTLGQNLVSELQEYIQMKVPPVKRKKLLLVNVFFAPQSIGGATRVVEDNLEVMLDKYDSEYDITVFTADANCREEHKLTSYQYKGVYVYRATTLWREHMDWHPKDSAMYDLFSEFLENEQPDLVHFHCVQRLTASIVEATRDRKIPYMVTVHDAWWISDYQFLVDEQNKVYPEGHPDPFETVPTPNNITLDESIDRRNYLKGLLNSAEKVLIVSESFAKIYRQNGIENIAVTKNGLSEKIEWLPKDTSYTDKVVCALIGGMSAHKGYQLLKQAIKEVQPENCEFIFVDHSKEQGYSSSENWGGVPITFIGREKQDNIVKLYQKIDVLFAPSIWPESFGLVTREAAACGCWVVASNLGGIGEDVIEGVSGHVIEPTQSAIEKVVAEIDQNPQKYKQLAKGSPFNPVSNQVKQIVENY